MGSGVVIIDFLLLSCPQWGQIFYQFASQFSYKTTISTIKYSKPETFTKSRENVWVQAGFGPIVVSSFQNRACQRIDNSPLFLFSMLFNELTHWNSYRQNSAINERGEERGIFWQQAKNALLGVQGPSIVLAAVVNFSSISFKTLDIFPYSHESDHILIFLHSLPNS